MPVFLALAGLQEEGQGLGRHLRSADVSRLMPAFLRVCRKKGKARARVYEELVAKAAAYVKNSQVDSITIPVGPRLGDKVLELQVSRGC